MRCKSKAFQQAWFAPVLSSRIPWDLNQTEIHSTMVSTPIDRSLIYICLDNFRRIDSPPGLPAQLRVNLSVLIARRHASARDRILETPEISQGTISGNAPRWRLRESIPRATARTKHFEIQQHKHTPCPKGGGSHILGNVQHYPCIRRRNAGKAAAARKHV
jgi:hypothetical protein